MAAMYKVCTIVGTRPEIIKLSEVIKRLDSCTDHTLVHTGQHYDANLSAIFFKDLDLRQPDLYLEAEGDTPVAYIGDSLSKFDALLGKHEFDAVLVYGDTNSAICTYAAKRRKIPIFHMEAGNRCFDSRVPEEINRKIIDHLADVNLTITEHARRNLLREGLDPQFVYKVGSSMPEIFETHELKLKQSKDVLKELGLEPGSYYIVSIHREENTSNPEYLDTLASLLNTLLESKDVLMPMHPKTAALFAERASALVEKWRYHLRVTEPLGFIDFVSLQKEAACTISDSGTIFEESSILGFPAVTVRDSFERPEGLDGGGIIVCSWDVDKIVEAVSVVSEWNSLQREVPVYPGGSVSRRVVGLILSLIDKVKAKSYFQV